MLSKFSSWRSKERGTATITIFILALPLIVGSFGFGFDEVRALYFKTYLQNRADLAVQNAVASNSSTQVNGTIILDPIGSVNSVYSNYNTNTLSYRSSNTLICPLNQQFSNQGCSEFAQIFGQTINCADLSAGGQYGLRFDVRENISTVFLRILGIKQMNIGTISAESLIRPVCP